MKERNPNASSRNVKLRIQTYDELDKYLTALVVQKGDRKLTLNDAVTFLLDEHYGRAKGAAIKVK